MAGCIQGVLPVAGCIQGVLPAAGCIQGVLPVAGCIQSVLPAAGCILHNSCLKDVRLAIREEKERELCCREAA